LVKLTFLRFYPALTVDMRKEHWDFILFAPNFCVEGGEVVGEQALIVSNPFPKLGKLHAKHDRKIYPSL
jgi:hypothetical protein